MFAFFHEEQFLKFPFAAFSGNEHATSEHWEATGGKKTYLSNSFHRFQFKSMLFVLFHGYIYVDYESCKY